MSWNQQDITLSPKPRGFHLVTREVLEQLPTLQELSVGVAHFFLKHTSASLCLSENAAPAVREDLERHFNRMVPEEKGLYRHTEEGPDDMPAHIKSALLGCQITIPVDRGTLDLGTWQGLYLCEHRNHAGSRVLNVTLMGE